MNRAAQLAAEAQLLGTLCKLSGSREERAELVHELEPYVFLEPEHEIVFASVRSLLLHDKLSGARLAVHLNNRGFPDVDLEKYTTAAIADMEQALNLARRLRALAEEPGVNVHYSDPGKVKHES